MRIWVIAWSPERQDAAHAEPRWRNPVELDPAAQRLDALQHLAQSEVRGVAHQERSAGARWWADAVVAHLEHHLVSLHLDAHRRSCRTGVLRDVRERLAQRLHEGLPLAPTDPGHVPLLDEL